jgi:hypothetical protein
MPKTHELLEQYQRGRLCEVGCVIDRRVAKAESELEGLPTKWVDVD